MVPGARGRDRAARQSDELLVDAFAVLDGDARRGGPRCSSREPRRRDSGEALSSPATWVRDVDAVGVLLDHPLRAPGSALESGAAAWQSRRQTRFRDVGVLVLAHGAHVRTYPLGGMFPSTVNVAWSEIRSVGIGQDRMNQIEINQSDQIIDRNRSSESINRSSSDQARRQLGGGSLNSVGKGRSRDRLVSSRTWTMQTAEFPQRQADRHIRVGSRRSHAGVSAFGLPALRVVAVAKPMAPVCSHAAAAERPRRRLGRTGPAFTATTCSLVIRAAVGQRRATANLSSRWVRRQRWGSQPARLSSVGSPTAERLDAHTTAPRDPGHCSLLELLDRTPVAGTNPWSSLLGLGPQHVGRHLMQQPQLLGINGAPALWRQPTRCRGRRAGCRAGNGRRSGAGSAVLGADGGATSATVRRQLRLDRQGAVEGIGQAYGLVTGPSRGHQVAFAPEACRVRVSSTPPGPPWVAVGESRRPGRRGRRRGTLSDADVTSTTRHTETWRGRGGDPIGQRSGTIHHARPAGGSTLSPGVG